MQNRTWIKLFERINTTLRLVNLPEVSKTQQSVITAIVDQYEETKPAQPRKKAKKNGKKRKNSHKAQVTAGNEETKVVGKKRGRKPKAVSTTDSVSEPETVGTTGAHGEPWEV